jgi:hypothetical protein
MAEESFEPLRLSHLPTYAQQNLWLRTATGEAIQLEPDGSFTLPVSDHLELRWAHPEGPPLTVWRSLEGENRYHLEWDGLIRLAGFVDRTHILEYQGLPLMMAELIGGSYPANYRRWPTLADLQKQPFTRDEERHDPSQDRHWYALLMPVDSPFADFVHHALVNGTAVDVVASFGDEASQWHKLVGLPLVLESLSLLSGRF